MDNLLSASSLLMTVVAIFFSLWYAEIHMALAVIPKNHAEDNKAMLVYVTGVYLSKALPLGALALLVFLIFLPETISLFISSAYIYRMSFIGALQGYNAVETAYCMVTFIALLLAIYSCNLAVRLYKLKKRLR